MPFFFPFVVVVCKPQGERQRRPLHMPILSKTCYLLITTIYKYEVCLKHKINNLYDVWKKRGMEKRWQKLTSDIKSSNVSYKRVTIQIN